MRKCLRLTIAGAVGVTGRILWRRCVEQLTRSRDVLGAPAVGEETVVADAVETVGRTWIRKRRMNSSASIVISL